MPRLNIVSRFLGASSKKKNENCRQDVLLVNADGNMPWTARDILKQRDAFNNNTVANCRASSNGAAARLKLRSCAGRARIVLSPNNLVEVFGNSNSSNNHNHNYNNNTTTILQTGTTVTDSAATNGFFEHSIQLSELADTILNGGAASILALGSTTHNQDLMFNTVHPPLRNHGYQTNPNRGGDDWLLQLAHKLYTQKLRKEVDGICEVRFGFSAYIIRGRKLSMVQDVLAPRSRPLNLCLCESGFGYFVRGLTIVDCMHESEMVAMMRQAVENKEKHFKSGCYHLVMNVWSTVSYESLQPCYVSNIGGIESDLLQHKHAAENEKMEVHGKASIAFIGQGRETIAYEGTKTGTKCQTKVKAITLAELTLKAQSTVRSQEIQLKADLASLGYLLSALTIQDRNEKVDELDLALHCESCTLTRVLMDALFCKKANNTVLAFTDASNNYVHVSEFWCLQFVNKLCQQQQQQQQQHVKPNQSTSSIELNLEQAAKPIRATKKSQNIQNKSDMKRVVAPKYESMPAVGLESPNDRSDDDVSNQSLSRECNGSFDDTNIISGKNYSPEHRNNHSREEAKSARIDQKVEVSVSKARAVSKLKIKDHMALKHVNAQELLFGTAKQRRLDLDVLACNSEHDVLQGMRFNKRSLLKGTGAHGAALAARLPQHLSTRTSSPARQKSLTKSATVSVLHTESNERKDNDKSGENREGRRKSNQQQESKRSKLASSKSTSLLDVSSSLSNSTTIAIGNIVGHKQEPGTRTTFPSLRMNS